MATGTIPRHLRTLSPLYSAKTQPRRSFITLPGTEATKLTESRILPYKLSSLYSFIADVDSYSSFIPYCLESKVTKWSAADKNGKKWPSVADLKVGWGGYEETFTSRLFCLPSTVVEALGGRASTSLSKSDLAHHASTFDAPKAANSIFESISTKWTLRPFQYNSQTGLLEAGRKEFQAHDHTEVTLAIEFQFSNPIYAALSKAVAPKVADIMIQAFERRAKQLLDGDGVAVIATSESITTNKIDV